MNSIKFNNGIFINNFLIDFIDESSFKKQILQALNNDQLCIKEYNGYITYSFLCNYFNISFRFYVTFYENQIDGDPYLIWLDSICEQKKLESSEDDLYNDVEALKKKLERNGIIHYKEKEKLSYYYSVNAVSIVLTGSMRSMSAIIGIEL